MENNEITGMIEQGILFGIGLAAYTTEKAGQVLGSAINSSNINAEQGKKTVDDTVQRAKSEFDRLAAIAKDTASRVFSEGEMGKFKENFHHKNQ